MPVPEQVHAVVREWVVKTDNDLINASHVARFAKDCPTDTVCFHAQQCVEKYIKALLVSLGMPFSRTHNIRDLLAMVPGELRPVVDARDQDRLTEYATVTRYPGGYEPIPLAEARRSVRLARDIRRAIRLHLPKQSLRGKRR